MLRRWKARTWPWPLFLVQDDLETGKLVLPLKKTVDMGDFTYHLIQPAARAESAPMLHVREWVLGVFAQD